ncbi:hypothetical protein [Microbacterium alcoholitolerans]|uniref:hypothetical protein n=1 Tax=unclassified Microbacterium TaxID=2609290 RepID=UPI003D1708F7
MHAEDLGFAPRPVSNERDVACAGPTNAHRSIPPIQNTIVPLSGGKTARPEVTIAVSDNRTMCFGLNRSSYRPVVVVEALAMSLAADDTEDHQLHELEAECDRRDAGLRTRAPHEGS